MFAVVGNTGVIKPGSRNNTGNLVHAVTALRMLAGPHKGVNVFRPLTDKEVDFVNTRCSHLVYIAANFLRLNTDSLVQAHRTFADNLERLSVPVVVFGLGAQAPSYSSDNLEIPEESKRLFRLIGERSEQIAVRGPFTAEVLATIGVTNTVVTGCQSAFWRMTPTFTGTIPAPSTKRVVFNHTGPWREYPLIRRAMDHGWENIGQMHWAEETLKNDGDAGELDEQYGKLFAAGHLDRDQYIAYISKSFYKFYDLDEWIEHLRGATFSFGTRFHGNMAALHAGVPALWVTHDSRTLELCEHLGLPHVSLQDARHLSNDELVARADFGPFLRKYSDNYRTFFEYVERAGLAHALQRPE